MAGVAANVSAFNTVVTYDLWEPYVALGRERRRTTCASAASRRSRASSIGIGTALIASGYNNIMDYIQLLFSFFNAPLFATFIIGMFWKRMTPWAGFCGLIAGTVGARGRALREQLGHHQPRLAAGGGVLGRDRGLRRRRRRLASASRSFTQPKPIEELQGLVHGMANEAEALSREEQAWYRKPSHARDRRARHRPRPEHHLLVGDRQWLNDASPTGDPPSSRASRPTRSAPPRRRDLFDIRRLIGGLFLIYGVILTVLGLGESDASIAKSAGHQRQPLRRASAMLVIERAASSPGRCGGRSAPTRRRQSRRAAGPGATATAPSAARAPGG